MITTKQRAKLRGLANTLDTIFQIGKGGINDHLIAQIRDTLLARELMKLRVLQTSPVRAREAAAEIAERTGADIVQVIGTRFIIYKRNEKAPKIEL